MCLTRTVARHVAVRNAFERISFPRHTAGRNLPFGASDHVVEGLLAIVESVQQQDKALFGQLLGEWYSQVVECRAVCQYLHHVASQPFNSLYLAKRVGDAFRRIDHCTEFSDKAAPRIITNKQCEQATLTGACSYGIRTLGRLGEDMLSRKEPYEQSVLGRDRDLPAWLSRLSRTLLCLHRYNSFAPFTNTQAHYGGGYFLWTGTHGIAIDPGHDYVRHLVQAGIPLSAIHDVVVTHAHPDHFVDLPALLSVLHEYRARQADTKHWLKTSYLSPGMSTADPERPEVQLLLSLSAYTYLGGIARLGQHHSDVHVLEPGQRWSLGSALSVVALETRHSDCQAVDRGVGLLFYGRAGSAPLLYTSDTAIDSNILKSYKQALRSCKASQPLLLCNLGGVASEELNALLFAKELLSKPEGLSRRSPQYMYKNHSGILGLGLLCAQLRPIGVLIGELGGECDGLRGKLAAEFTSEAGIPTLVADLGLTIRLKDCYAMAVAPGMKKQWTSLDRVKCAEHEESVFYLDKRVGEESIAKQSGPFRAQDSWTRNLPW